VNENSSKNCLKALDEPSAGAGHQFGEQEETNLSEVKFIDHNDGGNSFEH